MTFVRNQRSGDKTLDNFYEKVTSDGDASSFAGASAGARAVIRIQDGDGLGTEPFTSFRMTIPFTYLVGANQLMVSYENSSLPDSDFLLRGWVQLLDLETVRLHPNFDPATWPYYEEETSTSIILYNAHHLNPELSSNVNNSLLFSVPHTASAATTTDRVTVENQGDNIAIALDGFGDGLVMHSDNGSRFLLGIDNGGNTTIRKLS